MGFRNGEMLTHSKPGWCPVSAKPLRGSAMRRLVRKEKSYGVSTSSLPLPPSSHSRPHHIAFRVAIFSLFLVIYTLSLGLAEGKCNSETIAANKNRTLNETLKDLEDCHHEIDSTLRESLLAERARHEDQEKDRKHGLLSRTETSSHSGGMLLLDKNVKDKYSYDKYFDEDDDEDEDDVDQDRRDEDDEDSEEDELDEETSPTSSSSTSAFRSDEICPPGCTCGLQMASHESLKEFPGLRGRLYVTNCTGTRIRNATVLTQFPRATQILIFTGNELSNLPQNLFGTDNRYRNLKVIDLSQNQIRTVHAKAFRQVATVTWLNLSFNSIQLTSGSADRGGTISAVHSGLFKGFTSLRELHLRKAFNRVGLGQSSEIFLSVLTTVFIESELPVLRVLNLEENLIDKFGDETILCSMPATIERLHLAHNFISDLHLKFSCMGNLRTLDLRHNFILYLDERSMELLKTAPFGLRMYLEGNKFKCDCKLRPFYSWLVEQNMKKERQEPRPIVAVGRNNYTCATLNKGRRIVDLNPQSDLNCPYDEGYSSTSTRSSQQQINHKFGILMPEVDFGEEEAERNSFGLLSSGRSSDHSMATVILSFVTVSLLLIVLLWLAVFHNEHVVRVWQLMDIKRLGGFGRSRGGRGDYTSLDPNRRESTITTDPNGTTESTEPSLLLEGEDRTGVSESTKPTEDEDDSAETPNGRPPSTIVRPAAQSCPQHPNHHKKRTRGTRGGIGRGSGNPQFVLLPRSDSLSSADRFNSMAEAAV